MKTCLPAFLAFTLACSFARGDVCVSRGARHSAAAVVAKPIVAAPVQLFFVGAPVRIEALVASQLAADPAYRELQAFKKFLTEYDQFRAFQAQGASTARPASLVQQKCARCHGGGQSQGGFSLSQLDEAGRLSALRRVMHPDESLRMPKGEALSDEQRGALVQELLGLAGVKATTAPSQ